MIWHNAAKEDVAKELDSQPQKGLTDMNAGVRRAAFGENTLVTTRQKSGFTVIMGKLFSPLSVILIIISVLSAVVNINHYRAGNTEITALVMNLVYAAVLLLSAIISDIVIAARELSANSTIADIKRNALTFVRVRRNGHIREILNEELVPGDIIQLEVGDIIPADGRLLITRSFMCDERVLTGDDTPALKDSNVILPEETPVGLRRNMAFAGTVAVTGRAVMLITETGERTQLALKHGKRPRLISNRTPLVKSAVCIRSFGVWLMLCSFISVLSIYALGLDLKSISLGMNEIRRFIHNNFAVIPDYLKSVHGHSSADALFDGLLFFLTLVICTVPIGLPQNVMRSIAKGIAYLGKNGVMIHRFKKTELLSSTSVICTDKSGTLTLDKPSVRKAWPAGDTAAEVNEGFWSDDLKYLMRCCALCCERKLMYNTDSENEEVTGDRTEEAIIKAYISNGGDIDELLDKYPRCSEIPFDETRKLMTVVYDVDGVYMMVTKGAPEVLVKKCVNVDSEEIDRQAQAMFDEGLKVIAVAVQSLSQLPEKITPESIEKELTFVGLIGLEDPCREDVSEAVDACDEAGIRTVMITGDHPETASSVARKLHILKENEKVITSDELAAMTDKKLNAQIDQYSVFARITSEDKVRIIKSWQSRGACVLMTAGGMNDAPALHNADVSCSVESTATDVAVDAADITLSGGSFANIFSMIRQGRRIRKNLRNLTEFSVTCSAAQAFLLILGALLFKQNILALLPLLLLDLLLFLFVQPCFADEPAEKNSMRKMPDMNDGMLIGRFEKYRAGIAAFYIVFNSLIAYALGSGRLTLHLFETVNIMPTITGRTGMTMAFVTMAMGITLHAFCSRSERPVVSAGIFRNYKLLLSVLVTDALVILMTVIPQVAILMGFSSLGLAEWCGIAALLVIQFMVWEYPKIYSAVKF